MTYNREDCCWRCKQRGHTRLDCKRLPKKFCSRCSKDGVLTRDCPIDEKRETGRRRSGRHPAQIRIEYRPRPHIEVWIRRHRFSALLDLGSEVSCVREESRNTQERPQGHYILLADNTRVEVTETIRLPLYWQGNTYWHNFFVLPDLASTVFIGTDL